MENWKDTEKELPKTNGIPYLCYWAGVFQVLIFDAENNCWNSQWNNTFECYHNAIESWHELKSPY